MVLAQTLTHRIHLLNLQHSACFKAFQSSSCYFHIGLTLHPPSIHMDKQEELEKQ